MQAKHLLYINKCRCIRYLYLCIQLCQKSVALFFQSFQLLLDLQAYEQAEDWAERFAAQYPDQLQPYKLRMKLYFETGQTELFFAVLEQLRASHVEFDHETLEWIRLMRR